MAKVTQTVDNTNRKPYRTVAQKEQARKLAVKCADGAWRSTAPVSYHGDKNKHKE